MFWIVIDGREEIAHIIITIHFTLRLRSLRACSLEVVLGKSLEIYTYGAKRQRATAIYGVKDGR